MSKFGTNSSTLLAARSRDSAKDRRLAAVHEAGHVIVARQLGIRVMHKEIRKIEPKDSTEKEWIGSVQCLTEGVVASKRKMVGVAGLVAEACWNGKNFDHLFDAIADCPEYMSQSDWDLSDCLPGEPSKQFCDAMEQAFELLNRETGKLWKSLLAEARGLIVQTRQDATPYWHPLMGGSGGIAP